MTHDRQAPVAPLLYTIRDAASALGVSRDTIYRLVGRGALELIHVGAGSRITAASMDRLIQALRDNGDEPVTALRSPGTPD